jgi:hypothetical protein
MNILGFPGAYSQPLDANELITSVFFVPVARRAQSRGVFLESVEFGCFRTAWSVSDSVLRCDDGADSNFLFGLELRVYAICRQGK